MKLLLEEYGHMIIAVVCGLIAIVSLVLLMSALGKLSNSTLDDSVDAEATVVTMQVETTHGE